MLKRVFCGVMTLLAVGLIALADARADWTEVYFRVACEPSKRRLSVSVYSEEIGEHEDCLRRWQRGREEPPRTENGRVELLNPFGPDHRADCRLGDGTEVRIKVGGRQSFHSGTCGASIDLRISVWVAGVKIHSNLDVAPCHPNRPIFRSLLIEGRRVRTCLLHSMPAVLRRH
jgi:hypothetical protein